MADYYRDLIRLLRDAGYEFKRPGRGDHEIWWNPRTGVRVTVDRKLNSRITANAILKAADLPKAFEEAAYSGAVPRYRRGMAF